MSTNFAKTLVWKQDYDVILTSQTAHTKYKWLPYATEWNPPWKVSAYATDTNHHQLILLNASLI